MAIFKCKMCGGTIEFNNGDTVGICDSCGTKQTLPRLDDDRRANLYDRANHFRRNNEFDKAMGIYEQILSEDNEDAEAYWSLVLCRYGIEYVKDPATGKRVPTVNRAQYTSIFDDDNYKSALKYADAGQKAVYEEEASTINEIQKGILAISQKEEPFDVFICYKETDENGRRTQDSVLANDLYHQLTHEGFKVFFSRITLEDKLGTAYEPYIFAALNSAKVMVVIGTKPEYFNAVWVKNEWSRYLALIKGGAKKMLIPAYRDMDPYDLPEEFSHLQAQDMGKLGFMQDLIRGIKKLTENTDKTVVRETVTVQTADDNSKPLLERVFMFLEDGEWSEADEYCEKVLDRDPKNALAYIGKLMAELKVRRRAELVNCSEPFDGNGNYEKACRFGDEKINAELKGYIENINTRNENARLEGLYRDAAAAMSSADSAKKFESAANLFNEILQYKDSAALKARCIEKVAECKKNDIYISAKNKMSGTIADLEQAIEEFKKISGFKDADKKIIECREEIAKIKRHEEAKRIEAERIARRIKRIFAIGTPIVVALITIIVVINMVILPNKRVEKLINEGKYEEAYAILGEMGKKEVITESKYNRACEMIENGKYKGAYMLLAGLNYKDSGDKMAEIAMPLLKECNVGDTVVLGDYHGEIEWLVLDKKDGKALLISKYCLDAKEYDKNENNEFVTWETCTLRQWLNGDFINETFSGAEKALICDTYLQNPDNPEYGTDGGNDTTDKVFLLSIDETSKYLSDKIVRKAEATDYAKDKGIFVSEENGKSWWWMRSPGSDDLCASCMGNDGFVHGDGQMIEDQTCGVRPAMWVNIGK